MAWRGSVSRSFVSAARASTFRAPPAAPRLRPHLPAPPPQRPRGLPFANPRTMGELGCSQSLLSLAGAPSMSHLAIRVRASCELYHGTFCRTCQGGMEKMGDVSCNFKHPKEGTYLDTLYLKKFVFFCIAAAG